VSVAAFGGEDQQLQIVAAAVVGIGLSIWLIVKVGLHPFLGLVCGAFILGCLAGLDPHDTIVAMQTGFADVLGGTGLVIALGLVLGAILQHSGAARALAGAALRIVGERYASWGSLGAAMLIGLPLFFETGVVLLMPIVAAAAVKPPRARGNRDLGLEIMLAALAGLSVLHALLPPHPGPLLAVHELGASVGRTMLYGAMVAIPTAMVAGPIFARYASPHVKATRSILEVEASDTAPPIAAALLVVLLPVALISANAALGALGRLGDRHLGWVIELGNPIVALAITIGVALLILFRPEARTAQTRACIWREAMTPAGSVLLSIGAGGALKQVLIAAGLSRVLAHVAGAGFVSPIVLAWSLAALIRLGTGSATVATITAAGVMPSIVASSGASPEWVAIAIGAGSVFFSHVNDAGFWLVKSYLGTSTKDTFKTWSVLETVISVTALLLVLLASKATAG
jgi:GntP family gluconate:H+ symporter